MGFCALSLSRWFQALLKNKSDQIKKTYRCVTSTPPPVGPMVHHMLGVEWVSAILRCPSQTPPLAAGCVPSPSFPWCIFIVSENQHQVGEPPHSVVLDEPAEGSVYAELQVVKVSPRVMGVHGLMSVCMGHRLIAHGCAWCPLSNETEPKETHTKKLWLAPPPSPPKKHLLPAPPPAPPTNRRCSPLPPSPPIPQVQQVQLTGLAARDWGPTAFESEVRLITGRTHQVGHEGGAGAGGRAGAATGSD